MEGDLNFNLILSIPVVYSCYKNLSRCVKKFIQVMKKESYQYKNKRNLIIIITLNCSKIIKESQNKTTVNIDSIISALIY